MTASSDASFLVTVQALGTKTEFNVHSYVDTKQIGIDQYRTLMKKHIAHDADVTVEHAFDDTPKKRLWALTSSVPEPSTP